MFTTDEFSDFSIDPCGFSTTRRSRELRRSKCRTKKGICSIAGVAGAMIGGSLIGGILGSRSTGKAANTQAKASREASDAQLVAAREANALQERMFNRQNELYNEEIQRQEPFRWVGATANNRLSTLLGLNDAEKGLADYGKANAKFQEQDIKMDPGYQFRLEQGQKALERSAAARGGLFSGRAAKDLMDYGQGMASQEYGNAYNRAYGRFQDERNNMLQPLQSLARVGQTSTSAMGQASQNLGSQAGNYGNMVGNNMMNTGNAMAAGIRGAGDARASGYIGQANTRNNMIGSIGNAFANSGGNPFGNFANTQFGARVRGIASGVDMDEYGR